MQNFYGMYKHDLSKSMVYEYMRHNWSHRFKLGKNLDVI